MTKPSYSGFFLAGPSRIAFEQCLTREGVPSKSHSFYKYRANQFIKATNGRNPSELNAKEVVEILGEFGRDDKFAEWQFGQLADAVRTFGNIRKRQCEYSESSTECTDIPVQTGSAKTIGAT